MNNKRIMHIDIRLQEDEYKHIKKNSVDCGMTMSNYGRKLLLNHNPNKCLSDSEVEALNSLSDARADLIRIQNVLRGKPENVKKMYFQSEEYMKMWINAVNQLIIRWKNIVNNVNQKK